jgi:hypothetical protein
VTTPIRPGAPNLPPQPSQAVDPAKLAAQRAFFQAALGKAGAPQASAAAAPIAAAQPTAAAQPVQRATAPAEAPQKVLRPGSLIDIRV